MDIYVGSLPFKWKEKDLMDLFEPFGKVVSVKIVIDKITRQNKGFGFVSMEDEQAAMKAITTLHDTEHGGRLLIVNPSLPKDALKKSARPTSKKQDAPKRNDNKQLPPWLRKEY